MRKVAIVLVPVLILALVVGAVGCGGGKGTSVLTPTASPAPALTPTPQYSPGTVPPAGAPWPMLQHDAQHTGRSQYSGPVSPRVKWSYQMEDVTFNSLVIGTDGTVYVDNQGTSVIYAINADGSLKWSCQPPGEGSFTSPAIGPDGTVYVPRNDGTLYAINPDGSVKWSYKPGGGNEQSSPAIGADGTIYMGSLDRNLYAINPDGSLKWRYATEGPILTSPAIGPDGTIYVSSTDQNLYAINPDGSLRWRYATELGLSSPAIGPDGTIYTKCGEEKPNVIGGVFFNRIHAINPDGSLKWTYVTEYIDYFALPAIGSDGTVFVGVDDGAPFADDLCAIDSDGHLKWSYHYSWSSIDASPVIGADGSIYVPGSGGSEDTLYAMHPDGSLQWSYTVEGDWIGTELAIGTDSTIYFGSTRGKLYAIGDTPGATPLPTPTQTSGETWSFAYYPRPPAVHVYAGPVEIYYVDVEEYGDSEPVDMDIDFALVPEARGMWQQWIGPLPLQGIPPSIAVTRSAGTVSASFEFTHPLTGHLIKADLSGTVVGDTVAFDIQYQLPPGLQDYSCPLNYSDEMSEMEGTLYYSLPAVLTVSYQGTIARESTGEETIEGTFNTQVSGQWCRWEFHDKEYLVAIGPGTYGREKLILDAIVEWVFSNLRYNGDFEVDIR